MKYSILIVEDEEELLNLLKQIVKKYIKTVDFKIETTNNYNDALEKIKNKQYEIILSDYKLADGLGLDLLRYLKQTNTKRYTYFIISTSYNTIELLESFFDEGVDAFLSKPFSIQRVVKTVERLVKKVDEKKRLIENENLLHQYQEVVDCGSVVSKTDTRGIITYVNSKFCEISGYTKDELLGKNHNIVRHPDTPKEVFKGLWNIIKDKQVFKGVIKNRKKDGGSYYVDATIMPIVDSRGKIIEYLGMRHDITQRERYKNIIENKLDESQKHLLDKQNLIEQYESAFDHSTAVSRTDTNGVITYVNDEFCAISGYNKDELLGQKHSIIQKDGASKDTYKLLWETIANKQIYKGTMENKTKNKEPFWINITIVPIFDSHGDIIEYMGLSHDITEIYKLSQEIMQTQQDVIFQLGAIGESRSKETANHVKRVTLYSRKLAQLAKLKTQDVNLIEQASPMHDIGKIGIPDSILNKPAKLTSQEYESMKKHTQLGHSMLANSNREILKAAAIIAHEHHERWDGKGYPRGLKGEDIHIYGRITSIVDVFDALASKRCYKEAWKIEDVYDYFDQNCGIQFDPHLTKLFLENFESFVKIKYKYEDSF